LFGAALNVGGGGSDRPASFQEQMTAMGQSRRFGDVRASSALALKADIHHKARHVSKVPEADMLLDTSTIYWDA